MKSLTQTFTKKQKLVVVIVVILSVAIGFWKWRDTFSIRIILTILQSKGSCFPMLQTRRLKPLRMSCHFQM